MHLHRFSVSLFRAIFQQVSNVNQTSLTYLNFLKCKKCNELIWNDDENRLYEPWASIQIEWLSLPFYILVLFHLLTQTFLHKKFGYTLPYSYTLTAFIFKKQGNDKHNCQFSFYIYMCHSAPNIDLNRLLFPNCNAYFNGIVN